MKTTPNWLSLRSRETDWSVFRFRESVLSGVRDFFHSRGFLEIEAPVLVPYPTLDPNIHPFKAGWRTEDGNRGTVFLHSSPENSMKKLLAAGSGDIFFVGKVFRNLELTPLHNPEFTMVEWYRLGADVRGIEKDTEDLVRSLAKIAGLSGGFTRAGGKIELAPPWNRVTVSGLFKEKAGIDLDQCPDAPSLAGAAEGIGISARPGDDWETVFFRIFLEKMEPGLGFPKPVFLTEYPARMGLMAARKKEDPGRVERSELYIAGVELANGYTELVDPVEQLLRFEEDRKRKSGEGEADGPVDDELIHALELGLPACAGMALGLDRLIMLLLNLPRIEDVLLFPASQWVP